MRLFGSSSIAPSSRESRSESLSNHVSVHQGKGKGETMAESEIVGSRSKSHARRTVLLLKGSDEYSQWIANLCQATRIPRTTLVDLALTEWAERKGYSAPPVRL